MTAIPRYRPQTRLIVLSAGFRPFFLLGSLWAAVAIPLWLIAFEGRSQIPTAFSAVVWHVHEMTYGYGAAVVAGFLLTAIPNWTGRFPLQGGGLGALVLLWIIGRLAVLLSSILGTVPTAVLDLAFPVAFLGVVAREIVTGRNWRNMPMVGALALLLLGNLLVHLEAVGVSQTAEVGNRLGVATLLMLISFVGGRIVPSFTRNWLAKMRPEIAAPASFDLIDRGVLAVTAVALAIWVLAPEAAPAPWAELAAGLALSARLARWRGGATLREPLLWIMHIGYAWLSLGFLLLAFSGFEPLMPQTAALHALTAGAIGTMTLAVMTRASLGHTGRSLVAGPGTTTIYMLVTLAVVLRLLAPLTDARYVLMLSLAAVAWSGAFGLFGLLYGRVLMRPRVSSEDARSI
ncbi:MAG: NnrS family protein [Acidobacteriota bacterium]